MISGICGLLCYFWALSAITAITAILFLSLTHKPLLHRLENFRPASRKLLLWAVVVAPVAAGLMLSVEVVILPAFAHYLGLITDHCHAHSDKHAHLCLHHPADFSLSSFMGIVGMGMAGVVVVGVVRAMRAGYVNYRGTRTLLEFVEPRKDCLYRLGCDNLHAFTVGFLKPVPVISRGLEMQLSPRELEVVFLHEMAHVRRRDPLKVWLFSTLCFIFPKCVRAQFIAAYVLATEQASDAYVATIIPDRALIAETLVRVGRLVAAEKSHELPAPICHFGIHSLERRVHYLLSDQEGRSLKASIIGFCAAAVFMSTLYAHLLHNFIEGLLFH